MRSKTTIAATNKVKNKEYLNSLLFIPGKCTVSVLKMMMIIIIIMIMIMIVMMMMIVMMIVKMMIMNDDDNK